MHPLALTATPTPAPTITEAAATTASVPEWVTPVVTIVSVLIGSVVAPFFLELWKRVLDNWGVVRTERRAGVERILAAAHDVMAAAPPLSGTEHAERFLEAKRRLTAAIYTFDIGDDQMKITYGVQGRLIAAVTLADTANQRVSPYVNLYGALLLLRRIVHNWEDGLAIVDKIHRQVSDGLARDTAALPKDEPDAQ